MKKKVCMVVGNPFTNDARVTKEARSLGKAGFDVTVYALAKGDLPLFEQKEDFTVKRLRIARYSPVALKNPFRAIFEVLPAVLTLSREEADIYHAHDLDTLFTCYWAAKKNKAKLVYDSHELFLEAIKAGSKGTLGSKLYTAILGFVYSLIEKNLIYKADVIIDVSYFRRKVLSKLYGLDEKMITVLLNTPTKTWQKRRGTKLQDQLKTPNGSRFALYQGFVSQARGIPNLIKAVEFLPENTYLVIIGGGPHLATIKEFVSGLPFKDKIKFIPPVGMEELFSYTASADVGVIPMLNVSLNNFYTMPNKLFEYMSVGIPVAGVNFPDVAKVVKETNCGILFNPEDPQDIARAIKKILENPKKAKAMGDNGRRAFNKKYNWEVEEKKLLKVYRGL